MKYTRLVTDYETGEVHRITIGEYLTFTEFAEKLEVSRKVFTKSMLEQGVCQREYDDTAGKHRNRLHHDAVGANLGLRIIGERGPFDVLSPLGQEVTAEGLREYLLQISPDNWRSAFDALCDFINERMASTKRTFTAQMKLCWLLDHFSDMPINVIAHGIGVSEALAYKHAGIRRSQLEDARKLIRMPLQKGSHDSKQYNHHEELLKAA